MNDSDKEVFNLAMGFIVAMFSIIILSMTLISISGSDKVYESCKTMGTYYINKDKAIKCEVIEK